MATDILGGQARWSEDEEQTLSGALTDPSSLTEDTALDSRRRYTRLPMALRFLIEILEKDEWDSDLSLSTSAGTSSSNDISSKIDMIFSMNPAQMILEDLTLKGSGRRLKSIPVRSRTGRKPEKVSLTCTVSGCDKVFSRAFNLTSHMKTHSEGPFTCGIGTCTMAFARRHHRDRHVRLHTDEKPYSCDICKARFTRIDALRRHQTLCGVGSSFATDSTL
ncbi:hypothetical protein BGZ65_013011, partial [Modicella reniformis]